MVYRDSKWKWSKVICFNEPDPPWAVAVFWSMVIQATQQRGNLLLFLSKKIFPSFFHYKNKTKQNKKPSVLCDDIDIMGPVCEDQRRVEELPFFFHQVGGFFICRATWPTPTSLKNSPVNLSLSGSESTLGCYCSVCTRKEQRCEPSLNLVRSWWVLALGKVRFFC